MKLAALARVRTSRPARYVVVGGAGFLFEMIVLFACTAVLGLSDVVAVTASYWLGLVFSFVLQKVVAFENREAAASVVTPQILYFGLLVAVNYAFTLLLVTLLAPSIGVFFARTIALVITTFWNYLLYRSVIFNDRVTGSSSNLARLLARCIAATARDRGRMPLAVVTVALCAFLLLMARQANPVADDYAYYTALRESPSTLSYIVDHYLTHNGRLSQNLLVTLSFELFGKTAIQVVPALLLVSLSAAMAWAFALLVPIRERRYVVPVSAGVFVSCVGILSTPSPFDTYLWMTSSTVYLGSLVALFVDVALAVSLARDSRVSTLRLLATACILFLSQSFSEPTALVAIAAAIGWVAVEAIRRRGRRVLVASVCLAALVAGFFVTFLSPGTSARRAEVDAPVSLNRIFVDSFGHYEELFGSFPMWSLVIVFAAALVVALNVEVRISRNRFVAITTSFAVVMFTLTTYGVFVVSNYGSSYFPFRNFTLPTFGVIIALGTAAVGLFVWLRGMCVAPWLSTVGAPLGVVLLAVGVAGASLTASLQIQGLALRDSTVNARASRIADQLGSGKNSIAISAAPVLVRSQAVEVENPSIGQIPWLIEGFRGWYSIPLDADLVVSEAPAGYCLPGDPPLIRAEFRCR